MSKTRPSGIAFAQSLLAAFLLDYTLAIIAMPLIGIVVAALVIAAILKPRSERHISLGGRS